MTEESPRAALPKTPLLLTAATRWEAAPLAKGLGLAPAGEGRFEGSFAGRRIVLVKTGIGAAKTSAALEAGFVAGDFGLALSLGLCGAMQEGVKNGDLVADASEVEMDYVAPLRETAKALAMPFYFGRIMHTNVVLKPDMKRRLGHEHHVLACDMETAAVRRWTCGKVPAIGLRAVLDELDEEIPADAPDGETPAALARYALANASRLPRLIRAGLRSRRAMGTLARFLKAYLEAL